MAVYKIDNEKAYKKVNGKEVLNLVDEKGNPLKNTIKDLKENDIFEDIDEKGYIKQLKITRKEVTEKGQTIIVASEVVGNG